MPFLVVMLMYGFQMKVRLWLFTAFVINLAVIIHTSFSEVQETEKFVVIRARPFTVQQLDVIRELHDNMHKYDLDFWLTPTSLGHKADIMVRQERLKWLQDVLISHSIPYNITIEDVQQLILDREHKRQRSSANFSRRLSDEGGNRARYGLGEYHSYDHIVSWMQEIQRFYPDKARVITIGTTEEGRPIKGVKIGSAVHRTDKRVVWIDGGIHAREWAAVHTVIYIIDRLIADYETDPLVHRAMDQLNFYLFPVLNPDGYEYSRSGVSPLIRLWRKNRSSMICKKDFWFRERCCGGVDLNRNFDWFWGEIGSSSDRCSEIYHGKTVFSEAESRAVRDAMLSPELRGKVDAFLTLHTYSQMWIHPFSHQRKTVPEDISDIEQVGRKALSALESVYGTKYRLGTGADILYPSSGGSDDWAKGKLGAKYVFLMELRPGEEVWDGFILEPRQLIPTGRETWAGIKVVIEAVLNLKRDSSSSSPTIENSSNDLASSTSTTTTSSLMMTGVNTGDSGQVSLRNTLLTPLTHSISSVFLFAPTTTVAYLNTSAAITVAPVRFENLVRTTTRPVVHLVQERAPQWTRNILQRTPTHNRTITLAANMPFPRPFTSEPSFTNIVVQPTQTKLASPLTEPQILVTKRLQQRIQAHRRRMLQNLKKRKRVNSHSVSRRVSAFLLASPSLANGTGNPATDLTCFDRSPWCRVWMERSPQVCSYSSVFMRKHCIRSCRFC